MAVDVKGNVRNQKTTSELARVARSSLGIFVPVGAISCVSNLLTLTGPVFMLEVRPILRIFIQTDMRTVLSYLVKPLYEQAQKTFRER